MAADVSQYMDGVKENSLETPNFTGVIYSMSKCK